MSLGIGLSAKFVEKGGADLIIIYNSGRFRMAGRGSLAGMMPYGDANAIVLDMVSTFICPAGSFSIDVTIIAYFRPFRSNFLNFF